jgi:hypothetical protein
LSISNYALPNRAIPKLLRHHGKDESLIRRLEKYVDERMTKRLVDSLTTKEEVKKSAIITLCHGDTW